MGQSKTKNKAYQVTLGLFIAYLIILIWILIFKLGVEFSYMSNRNVNIIPFSEFFIPNGKVDPGGLIMNIIIFIPFGIYTGIIFKMWPFGKQLVLFFCTSLLFEAIQYVMRIGAFDITDTITNTTGGIIGLLMYKAIEKISGNVVRAQQITLGLASTGTLLMILLLVLLKLNILPIQYR